MEVNIISQPNHKRRPPKTNITRLEDIDPSQEDLNDVIPISRHEGHQQNNKERDDMEELEVQNTDRFGGVSGNLLYSGDILWWVCLS